MITDLAPTRRSWYVYFATVDAVETERHTKSQREWNLKLARTKFPVKFRAVGGRPYY